MAKKETLVSQPQTPKAPVTPTPPNWLTGTCTETDARIIHVAQKFYRASGEVIQECGTGADGEPDAAWVACDVVPPKVRSMLGLT